MTSAELAVIIAAFLAAVPGILAWNNQRKVSSATITGTITDSAIDLVERHDKDIKQLDERNSALKKEIDHLEEEIKAQALAIENANARYLKLRLAYSIISSQLIIAGFTPAISEDEIDSMPLQELRTIAEGLSNARQRRDEAKRTRELK